MSDLKSGTLEKTIPARKKVVKFNWIRRNFLEMNPGYRRVRARFAKKMDSCGWCKYKFVDGDTMNLAQPSKGKNTFLCNSCADQAEAGI